jgi:hypothetical protein
MLFKANTIYLACSKGECSIFDQLIKIMKQTPKRCNVCQRAYDPKPNPHIPDNETEKRYTHVGLYIPSTDTTDPEIIQYWACREEAGVFQYEEPADKFDFYEIHLKKPRDMWHKAMELHCEGSMISDMGYQHLKRDNCMGSAEWAAYALNLGFPSKYTITKLIEFAQET